jgi:hypothetical protein
LTRAGDVNTVNRTRRPAATPATAADAPPENRIKIPAKRETGICGSDISVSAVSGIAGRPAPPAARPDNVTIDGITPYTARMA